jgi:hypothetical protein
MAATPKSRSAPVARPPLPSAPGRPERISRSLARGRAHGVGEASAHGEAPCLSADKVFGICSR